VVGNSLVSETNCAATVTACSVGRRARSAAEALAESTGMLGKSVAKGSVSMPSTSARRCAYSMVYCVSLWHRRAGSKSRPAAANQELWRPSSSTWALTTAPNGRGEGGPDGVLLDLHEEEWIRLDLHLLALDGGIPLLGREAEVLARSGVLANTVDVDLALEEHGESHQVDGVGGSAAIDAVVSHDGLRRAELLGAADVKLDDVGPRLQRSQGPREAPLHPSVGLVEAPIQLGDLVEDELGIERTHGDTEPRTGVSDTNC
jgi:hypothetical protein